MELSRFVAMRQPIWDELEAGLERLEKRPKRVGHQELEELALRYRQVLHDHALAAARFPGTGVTRRLARLSLRGTHRLVRSGERDRPSLWRFITVTFPRAFQRLLPSLGVAVALFVGAAFLGLFLAAVRPGLATAFLGPERVADLERGTLWTEALTTTTPPAVSSSGIATNNLSVAITAWAGGAVAGALTLYVVLLNGFFFGALMGVTMHYSMADELLEFVTAHGILELSLILVAAAAGFELARALFGTGDRPRSEALAEAGRDSLWVLLGCLPWFVVLAIVETFVSPDPTISHATKLALGVALEAAFFALALNPVARRREERRERLTGPGGPAEAAA